MEELLYYYNVAISFTAYSLENFSCKGSKHGTTAPLCGPPGDPSLCKLPKWPLIVLGEQKSVLVQEFIVVK